MAIVFPPVNSGGASAASLSAIQVDIDSIDSKIDGLGGEHVRLFSGTVYYVDSKMADDTGTGLTPATAKKTITAAITAATAGDGIEIKAGTYTEDIDLNKLGLEMWPELGTIVQGQAADQAVLISGNYCGIKCEHGALRVNPISLKTGVKATGSWSYLTNVRVQGASIATIGYDIVGSGCVLQDCRANNPLTAAFKIQGDMTRLDTCCTGGTTSNSSIGFWVTNSCDKLRMRDCGSQGHATAGFQVDSGVTNAVFADCYSGGGDGARIDNGTNSVWSNYTFDDKPQKLITVDGITTHNIFKVTGAVRVSNIYAHVETITAATASNIHIEAYSENGTADMSLAPGNSIASLPAGALIVRNGPVTDALVIVDPTAGPAVEENASYRDPVTTIDVVKDTGALTYIRLVLSAATSGALHWHCQYSPLSDDGFLEPV
jgi:hypothetical protein